MRKIIYFILKTFLLLLDFIITLFITTSVFILISGGNEIYMGQLYISFYSARNLLIIIIILLPIRFFTRQYLPFLNIKKLDFQQLPQKSSSFLENIYHKLLNLKKNDIFKLLIIFIFISTIIKILNAWNYYGFFSGDDVEILEMSFANIFNWKWEAWNLRNAFYPIIFIYPIQLLLKIIGINDLAILIFAGRFVVIFFSTINIFLVYKITKNLSLNKPAGLIAAFFLAFSQIHITFASSVLPRTVSSFFILLSLMFLTSRPKINSQNNIIASLAGVALGIGAIIRFSEIIFIIPCLIYLIMEKRIQHAFLVLLSMIVT
jgi:hypothetical protein